MRTILSKRIRELRLENNLSQMSLAEKFNLSKQAISHWETGLRIPDSITLNALADMFGVSTDYLLGRTDYKEINDILTLLEQCLDKLKNVK